MENNQESWWTVSGKWLGDTNISENDNTPEVLKKIYLDWGPLLANCGCNDLNSKKWKFAALYGHRQMQIIDDSKTDYTVQSLKVLRNIYVDELVELCFDNSVDYVHHAISIESVGTKYPEEHYDSLIISHIISDINDKLAIKLCEKGNARLVVDTLIESITINRDTRKLDVLSRYAIQ